MAKTTSRISSKLQDLLSRPSQQNPLVSAGENWHAPAIAPDGPRPVRPTRMARITQNVSTVALASVLIVGALVGNARVGKLDELYRHGQTVKGQVVSDEPDLFGGYQITYHYVVGSTFYRGFREYRTAVDKGTELGLPLTITYLPREPAYHHIGLVDAEEVSALRIAWLLGTLAAGLFIEFLRFKFRRRLSAQSAIVRDYVAVPAKVVDVGMPVGRSKPRREVTFDVRLPDGRERRTSLTISAFEAERLRVNPETTLLTNLANDFHLLDQMTMAEVDEPRGYPR